MARLLVSDISTSSGVRPDWLEVELLITSEAKAKQIQGQGNRTGNGQHNRKCKLWDRFLTSQVNEHRNHNNIQMGKQFRGGKQTQLTYTQLYE